MSAAGVVADVHLAMQRLHWELRDLFVAALAYGDVGTESDVAQHLRTGTHLSTTGEAVLGAALNDALIATGDPLRIVISG